VVAEEYLSMCTAPGADFIKKGISEHNVNRVVVAACTPKTHEPVFRAVVEEAGLSPSFFEFANIREHVSYVYQASYEEATEVAKQVVAASVGRATLLEEVPTRVIPVTPKVLVIGGGVGGLQAALDAANAGYPVTLVERSPTIGGKMAMLDRTFPTDDCSI
jgi:heterodisulfide reductase subunit A